MPSIKTARALWMHTYDVNVAATHGLTVALAPLLVASTAPNGARLIFLTSGLSSLTGAHARPSPAVASPDAIPPGWPKPMERLFMGYAYRAAKVALNMCMLHWFHLLHSDGVKVWAVSPGFLATCLMGSGNEALMRKMGAREPSIGGEAMRGVVEGERDGQVGLVVTGDGAVQEW